MPTFFHAVRIRCLHALLALLAVLLAPCAGAAGRYALVIGNAAYQQPLLNPVNDARAMADRLRRLGFVVVLRTDIVAREVAKASADFAVMARGADVALVFYAGHGAQAGAVNYLLPVGAVVDQLDAVRIRAQGVAVNGLVGDLQRSGARAALLVLDACREEYTRGPAPALAALQGFSDAAAPRGVVLAYSAGPGARARDFWSQQSHNSPYTAALLEALEVPGLPVSELFARVAERVSQITHDAQKPQVSFGETSSRLVLNSGSGTTLAVPGSGATQGAAGGAVARSGAGAVPAAAATQAAAAAPAAAANNAGALAANVANRRASEWPAAILRDLNYEVQMQLQARPFPRQRLERRARGGDVVAQTALGYGLADGATGSRQVGAGKPWLERAAKRGFPIAQAYLAELLMVQGDQASLARAATLLDDSAAAGYAPAYAYKIDLGRKTGATPEDTARNMIQMFKGFLPPPAAPAAPTAAQK